MQGYRTTTRKKRRAPGEADRVVLELVKSSSRPVTAYEIVKVAEAEEGPMLPMQVYRCLDRLQAEGKVIRIATKRAFIPAADDQPVHFLCTACGEAVTAPAPAVHHSLSEICDSIDFAPRERHLEILGVCSRCESSSGI